MSSPNSALRHRGPKDKPKANGQPSKADSTLDSTLDTVLDTTKQAVTSEWDYKLALSIITALSFLTRFLGINHPDEVVFDEVHFGKVRRVDKTRRATD
jgi:dolichyl-phosphate-mannose-protein mannosyltransferase